MSRGIGADPTPLQRGPNDILSKISFPRPNVIPIEVGSAESNNMDDQYQPNVYLDEAAQREREREATELASVLRRNQACLACRRRKLKCDAQKPHCSTCVRSYKHLLRTSPRSNPQLSCEYDDVTDSVDGAEGEAVSEDEADSAGKKKRKSNDGRGKKRKGTEEADALKRKIEELEAKLAQKAQNPSPAQQNLLSSSSVGGVMDQRPWRPPQQTQQSAPSPTAFLEMLSSAATEQAPQPAIPGMRSGVSEQTMASAAPAIWAPSPMDPTREPMQSTGLTPFLNNQDWQPEETEQAEQSAKDTQSHPAPESRQDSFSTDANPPSDSRRTSNISPLDKQYSFSSGSLNPQETQGYFASLQSTVRGETNKNGAGPWRDIETADQTVPNSNNSGNAQGAFDASMGVFPGMEALDEETQQQLLMDLFWPGWPTNLPEPNVVNDLVEAFFNQVPNMTRLLNRPRLLARLALPPTHSNFPHPSLIHAICASSATWCAPSVFAKGRQAAGTAGLSDHAKASAFGFRQAAYGKDAVTDGLNTGNRLFDVVRAMIIFSRVFIDDTRMLECWAYSGLVARMILPLGLNVRSAELSLKSVMLPPPGDALEREERRVAVWMALYHDTIASAASGWGTSMSLEELSIPFPCSLKDFESGAEYIPSNPQDLDSPDIWTRHPVVDPFVLVMKASVLLNRVNRFVRKWKNRHIRDNDDLDGMQRPEFRELSNAIACFQMSFPPALRNPCKLNEKRKIDIDLVAAHMMPHAATICLYEPFADVTDPHDPASRRLISATQSVGNIVQQLAGATDPTNGFDRILHSSASVCLITAARTSMLFFRQYMNVNDHVQADSHRMDVEIIRMALAQYGRKFKIGHHHSQLIEYFLDRATNPTYEKLQAHYPEHPRPGAIELHPSADLGLCIMNALNVKRGFWKISRSVQSASMGQDVSPLNSTPESAGYASSLGGGRPGSSSGPQSTSNVSGQLASDSPGSQGRQNSTNRPSPLSNPNGISAQGSKSNSPVTASLNPDVEAKFGSLNTTKADGSQNTFGGAFAGDQNGTLASCPNVDVSDEPIPLRAEGLQHWSTLGPSAGTSQSQTQPSTQAAAPDSARPFVSNLAKEFEERFDRATEVRKDGGRDGLSYMVAGGFFGHNTPADIKETFSHANGNGGFYNMDETAPGGTRYSATWFLQQDSTKKK